MAEDAGEDGEAEDEEEEDVEGGQEPGDGEAEEAEDQDGGDVDVDFEFFDPNEDDYHSVGDLLKSGTWEFVALNFAELADSIVGQGNIGTLIKSDAGGSGDDKDSTLCGMLTALNMRQFVTLSWPKAVATALLAKANKHAEPEVAKKFRAVLQDSKAGTEVGLLLSERFVNLPPQLIPPLHRALQEDIQWSCSTPECPAEERPFYAFTHFVGVARCFEAAPAPGPGAPLRAKRRNGPAVEVTGPALDAGGLDFPRMEDQVYFQRASFSFTFPLPSAIAEKRGQAQQVPSGERRGKELRAVYGLTRKALERVVAELPGLLGAAA